MADVTVNERPGGAQGAWFCSASHPTDPAVWCRRIDRRHDGPHRAFVFSIIEPEEWE